MEVLLFLLFSLTFVWILLFTQFLLNISILAPRIYYLLFLSCHLRARSELLDCSACNPIYIIPKKADAPIPQTHEKPRHP